MSATITADSITADETIPVRSRTYSPEVVAKVSELLKGTPAVAAVPATPGDPNATPPVPPTPAVEARGEVPAVKNVSVGTFPKEGAARSALVTLNKLLAAHGHTVTYSGTVREQEDGTYKAILINKPAKHVTRKNGGTPAAKPAAKPAPAQAAKK